MHPVLVVGAGPVGMLTALLLAHFDVPSIVLEAKPERAAVGSRAICFQRDVLDILHRVGVGEPAVRRGVTWQVGRTYVGEEEVLTVALPDSGSDRFPPFINLSQTELERMLQAQVAAEPRIDLRWGHEVAAIPTGTHPDDDRVMAVTEDGDQVAGSWLVGCDGAHSRVRHLIGAGFDGESFDEQFLIADIEADLPFPAERRFHFDPAWNPGRQVLVHPQPDSIWRIDWQVPSDFDLEAERSSGALDGRIRAITGDTPYRLEWVSAYRFHQRLADPWRRGRVLLAGDAAHLMSPFGARGLNSGAQDAENLAWKLAWVRHGWGGATLVDSYAVERQPAARENLRVTGNTMRFLVPPDEAARARRHEVLAAAGQDPEARAAVDSGKLAEPFWYVDSPLTTVDPAEQSTFPREAGVTRPVVPGVLCPDHPLSGDAVLRDLLGHGFAVLAACAPDARSAAVALTTTGEMPVAVHDLSESAAACARLGLSEGRVLLVRPDGHVAAHVPVALLPGALRRAAGGARTGGQ